MGFKAILLYYLIYLTGVLAFLIIIADPFTISTYFSDNSLLPGLANREFSLATEAEYYLKDLQKLTKQRGNDRSLANSPGVVHMIRRELENFGLEVLQQNFAFLDDKNLQYINGTNLYSIMRGERSTSSECITLCIPYKTKDGHGTLPSVAIGIALTKYFSTKSYWAKDVIILFADHYDMGTSAWLDAYHDIKPKNQYSFGLGGQMSRHYDSLPEHSGPMQAAIILEMLGREFTKVNVKIQGLHGQLPNLDLFNLVIELAARESITPHFLGKSLPFNLSPQDLYIHHLETAIAFMKNQATMKSDGLHGLFLQYAIQSLTLEAPEYRKSDLDSYVMTSSLLNMGRFLEGIFRSLNNLTERFNRSFYFYIIVSLRRFTSIGYYMTAFGLLVLPVLLKALQIHMDDLKLERRIGARTIILLSFGLILFLISTFNISAALFSSVVLIPLLILI